MLIGTRVVIITTGSPRGLNGTTEPARFQGVIREVGKDFICFITDERRRVFIRNDEIVALVTQRLGTGNKRRTLNKR
jgi:hypothetical protein